VTWHSDDADCGGESTGDHTADLRVGIGAGNPGTRKACTLVVAVEAKIDCRYCGSNAEEKAGVQHFEKNEVNGYLVRVLTVRMSLTGRYLYETTDMFILCL
jgi:hypothetical protein